MSDFSEIFGRGFDKLIEVDGDEEITYTPYKTGVAVVIKVIANDQVGAEDNTGDTLFHIFADATKGVAEPLEGDRIVTASGEKFKITKVRLGGDGTAELRARSAQEHN